MQMQVYHLQARSPFHLGERGIGLETSDVVVHADTVFSALCTMGREVYGTGWVEELLAAFQGEAPFLLSSAFPYALVGDKTVRLYPRPLGVPPGVDAYDVKTVKRLKHVAFVSEVLFLRWIKGQTLASEVPQAGEDPSPLLAEGQVWIARSELSVCLAYGIVDGSGQPAFWYQADVPRVTVDRIHSSSAVYQAGRVSFQRGGGLWLGIAWGQDAELRQQIENVLTLLGDAGMGGERSSGHGQFDVAGSEAILLPDPAESCVLLSPYWPANTGEARALTDPRAAYRLLVRRGWIASPEGRTLRRKAVRMVGEGAVLPTEPYPRGGLAEVTPDRLTAHRVYRYGCALPVGMAGGVV